VAKFTVPVEHLPPPAKMTGDHVFRFRVISEDRNRISQYSTLYVVQSKGQIFPQEEIAQVTSSGSVVSVYWNTPSIYNVGASAVGASVLHNHESEWKQHPADIFVSWDDADFEYFGRTIDSNISIIKRDGATTLRVLGQSANYPPCVCEMFKIYDTGNIEL
jgi:hypothetical protein